MDLPVLLLQVLLDRLPLYKIQNANKLCANARTIRFRFQGEHRRASLATTTIVVRVVVLLEL
jgi:hypothetical protein